MTVDALPFPLYLHGFAYGRTHKKSLQNKKYLSGCCKDHSSREECCGGKLWPL